MGYMDPKKLSPAARIAFKMIEFDENERLVTEIRKHPVGLLFIYIGGTIITLTLVAIALVTAALMQSESADIASIGPAIIAFGIVLAVFSLIITTIEAYLYRSNVILVTTEKISQLVYHSLFNRKISQLSIGDVQDVTVRQEGIIAHIFNYGTLVIETAGEQQNYNFTFVPDPYKASKSIVGSHEENLKQYGN